MSQQAQDGGKVLRPLTVINIMRGRLWREIEKYLCKITLRYHKDYRNYSRSLYYISFTIFPTSFIHTLCFRKHFRASNHNLFTLSYYIRCKSEVRRGQVPVSDDHQLVLCYTVIYYVILGYAVLFCTVLTRKHLFPKAVDKY